jgi:uncharacterized caspase-like protein
MSTYHVGQEKFTSRVKAEQEFDRHRKQTLVGILPITTPVRGRALVVIPSLEQIEQTITYTGNRDLISKDIIDYIKQETMKNVELMFTSLEKRQIFDELTLEYSNIPQSASLGDHDFLIYLLTGPGSAQWYFKSRGDNKAQAVAMDMEKLVGAPGTTSWLDSIEELAKTHKITEKAVVSASRLNVDTISKKSDYNVHDAEVQYAHWAVIIGVSNYKDTRIPSLRYASRDAESFYNWIVSTDKGKYSPSRVKLLLDKDATGQNIKHALFEWLNQVLEEDVVTIYFAGHGSPASPDTPDNLFIFPHDVQYDKISTTGFPMWDVETALKRFVKAKKVVVIADACHSGGVGQSFDVARRSNRGVEVNPINTGFQSLSMIGDGVCVISACDDKQISQESKDWGGGHGVFTYYLLKGLDGEADYSKDNQVTLGELIPYLSEQVRRETKNAQSPTVAGKFDPALAIGKKN